MKEGGAIYRQALTSVSLSEADWRFLVTAPYNLLAPLEANWGIPDAVLGSSENGKDSREGLGPS